jgi:soluble lytic murein transglycosylase-like protein
MRGPPELIDLVHATAGRHNLNPALVCAVIEQESSWNPWAIRYEAAFRDRYVVPLRLQEAEEIARSTSWGLMQVMGQVAREYGFTGNFLAELCSPNIGVDFGCLVLSDKLAKARGDVAKGLSLWNGGGNPDYSRSVISRLSGYSSK